MLCPNCELYLYLTYESNRNRFIHILQKKFIISEEGKDYVLSSIGVLWRSYKSRLKGRHYFKFNNEKDRWQNRPKIVPDAHFRDLLDYWDLEEVQVFVMVYCLIID